ncbi:hypothetical protein V2H45_24935 [Tumidithrix elongata RA019]|uniref:Uncharacterized protein n=1 Tax=Tumidithrix elongata BACA0141 TaxID=2716417 RepID=A0AAW9Q3X3_9CYAN|nr:hypothetical protein [Tumidithrix elongata RA019]
MKAQRTSLLAIVSTVSIALASLAASPSYAKSYSSYTDRQANPDTRIAQVFRTTFNLPAGQEIVTKLDSKDTLYIGTGDTAKAQLRVQQNITASNGTILIPAGAVINGEFVPVQGGSKFVARSLTSSGATVRLTGESATINDVKDPRETSLGSIATDSAIGAGAAAILSGVIGDRVISTEKVLAGAVLAGVIGNVTAPQVTVIEPNNPLTIVTSQTLTFVRRGD